MKEYKNKQKVTQQGLKGILEGEEKTVELYVPYTYEDLLRINNQKMKKIKLRRMINIFEDCLENIEDLIEAYKELYNKTEYFESKSIFDYKYKQWNEIRKVNGRLTKYYNKLKQIYIESRHENE